MRSILLVFTVLYSSLLLAQKPAFKHPGILLTAADLAHLKAVALDHRMPEYGSYELLRDLPLSSADYTPKGSFRIISRDGDYAYTKSSFEADFSSAWLNALMWAATGDSAHAKRSLAILEAYADSLTTIPNTNDAPLLAGLEGLKIINAMEILRYTYKIIPAATTKKINRMILKIFLPVCKKFYDTPAYTNGNWGPIVTKTYLSAAIYFDNRTMYKKAVEFFYNAHDNGTIRNYISATTGQIQESGRDQGHSQLGLGALATVCQIAWNQGDDLYSAFDNRLLKGFEYVAKYNLGSDDVPFTTWQDVTGKYSDWTAISPKGRGHFIPIYEMVYNHYVRLKGLAMPYTSQVIQKIRPEGYDRDQPGFGTLLYYGSGQQIPVAIPVKAYSFDLRDVRLLASPFKDNMDREGAWMLSLPVDRLLHSFRVNAGLPTVNKDNKTKMPQPLGGWEALDMELRGHSIGHLLSGLAFQYAATGNPAFRIKADSLVTGLAQVQQALNHDGYLSAFPEEYIQRNIAGGSVWAPWYTLHKLVAGLLDQYNYAGSTQALDIAKRMGDWARHKLDTLSADQLQRMLRNEFGGINEAWYNLYAATGDQAYKALGDKFYHKAVLDPLAAGTDDLPGLHANTVIAKINGEARDYELTGNERSERIVRYFWDDVIRNQTFAIGSNSDKEHFFTAGAISKHLSGYTGETCNTYNMLKVTRHLFCWTAEERYAEYYEQALYNHILGQQDPETGMVCYFTPLAPGAYKLYSTPDSSFWCCVGTGFESHSKYGEAIYYHDRQGIFVNLFIPSVLTWREKGIRLRQETTFPDEATTRLIMDSVASAGPIGLYIRYPQWAAGGVRITINAKDYPVHQPPGSYIRLLRKWRAGDSIGITYPMQLRLVPAPDDSTIAAVADGPIILAADEGTENMRRPFHNPRDPYEYFNYDYHIPTDIDYTLPLRNRSLAQSLLPTGASLGFRTANGLPPIRFRPYYRIHRHRTVVYWDISGKLTPTPADSSVVSLSSPDEHLNVVFHQSELSPGKKQMSYRVDYKGRPVITPSALDIRLDNRLSEEAMGLHVDQHADWCENLRITHIDYYRRDTTWHPLYGERSSIPDRYNAAVIHLVKDDNPIYTMDVEIRCYNEGVALRYFFPENPKGTYYRVTAENTEFQLPAGTQAWFTHWAQGPYSLLPLKAWPGEAERPLTLQLPDSLYACLTEAGMVDYTRTKFKLSDQKENTIVTSMYGAADLISPVGTPWRLILIGERPGDLIEHNYLVEDLNPPNKIAGASWITPGKQMRLMTQTPAAAFANIDFLVRHHMQYLLLDWKWYGPAYTFASDATRPEPSVDLPAILRYAKSKDIGVWLYVNMQALYAQSDSLFRVYSDWGVKGVKFGFVQVGSHRWTTWLEDMLHKTAQNKLMVDVHDDWRPTGEQRTWPNLLTAEGVRGNEEMPDATHNTILPFTRFIAGGADYTLCYYSPRIRTTHAHQLAMAAVYYSPLQTLYWYDTPADSHDEPELEFWDTIPTTWDETRVLQGYPGQYVTIARRKGEQWFVGTLNNTQARSLPIDLGFLPKGKTFEAAIYSDDSSVVTATHVRIDHRTVDDHTILHTKLLASGGQAIWIRPSAQQPQPSTPAASATPPAPSLPSASTPAREPRSPAATPVWQWSVPVTGGNANPHARAWLWIPPTCRTVKAVILTQNNMEELSIVENAHFRERMSALGIAEVWVSPMFDHRFLFTQGAGEVFNRMMQDLADSSGYTELAHAPVIGLGHSAAASWPYYLAAWAPDRTLACISVSGQWPYVRDTRFAFDIWRKDQNIDFIPSLETMGEYEAADTWSTQGLRERQAHPAMPLSMLACPAEGHFAATQKKIDYLAFWISKAMYYRLPRHAGQPLRPVDPLHTGWLMERWHQTQPPTTAPAPVANYKGDPTQAFWFFDRETVEATRRYQSAYRSMKTPLIAYVQHGDTVQQQNTHLQVELPWQPEDDGIKFVLHPAYLDTVPGESPRPAMWTGLPVGAHSPHPGDASAISITRVVGPFRPVNDTLFELSLQKETPAFLAAMDTAFVDKHRPLVFTFAAVSPGDDIFKPGVQQAEMPAPAANTQGVAQQITFDSIADPIDAQPIPLHAASDAGLRVHFTVIDGPAAINDDTLYLMPLPPKTRYPVKVTVAAWQYGHRTEPKVQSAPVIIRKFYLRRRS